MQNHRNNVLVSEAAQSPRRREITFRAMMEAILPSDLLLQDLGLLGRIILASSITLWWASG